jgi:hypothetical protein
MIRYFFHVRDGSDVALDPEGLELADLEAAQNAALEAARDTLSHDIKQGFIDLRLRIDVEDDAAVHCQDYGARIGTIAEISERIVSQVAHPPASA